MQTPVASSLGSVGGAVRALRPSPIIASPACLVLTYAGAFDAGAATQIGHRFEVPGEQMIIGRGTDADLQVERDAVSRRHARIHRQGGHWFASDLQSTNGTYINDHPIDEQPCPLRDGDELRVGVALFRFLCGPDLAGSYFSELGRLAESDGLTGAGTRRHLLAALGREVGRAARHRRPLSLIRFDVEGFRGLADSYGTLTGDFVLREVALRARPELRPDDALFRCGEEQFAVLLPETGEEEGQRLGFKLGTAVAREPFDFTEDRVQVSLALGVATLPLPEEGAADAQAPMDGAGLLRAAEEQLAKGRRAARR